MFSSPLRKVDRARYIDIEDKSITVKFPYNKEMIREIQSIHKKLRSTDNRFDKETKKYFLNYNEYNLLVMFNWSAKHRFEYSDKFMKVYRKCKDILDNISQYAIQLVVDNDKCFLRNAPDTLQKYWTENMHSKSTMEQIISAADQNIDIVNNLSLIHI